VALVRERTIPTERPPPVGEVSANFCGLYSSTLGFSSALDGDGWLTPRPGRLNLGKEIRYPLCRGLGEPQGRSGQLRKISPAQGSDPRTAQPALDDINSIFLLNIGHFTRLHGVAGPKTVLFIPTTSSTFNLAISPHITISLCE
jgi:hypothetical protein